MRSRVCIRGKLYFAACTTTATTTSTSPMSGIGQHITTTGTWSHVSTEKNVQKIACASAISTSMSEHRKRPGPRYRASRHHVHPAPSSHAREALEQHGEVSRVRSEGTWAFLLPEWRCRASCRHIRRECPGRHGIFQTQAVGLRHDWAEDDATTWLICHGIHHKTCNFQCLAGMVDFFQRGCEL